ncbi:MAG TPA: WD40 repeat domain-containing protein [Gemmata sp.]|nr:WD40 repeat domain-containing protein [Gemmata sp.]
MRVLKAAEGEVRDLAFSPDGLALAAVVRYHGVFLWNLTAPQPVPVRLDDRDADRGGLVFAPDGRSVAWLASGTRRVYDRDTRETADQPFALTHLGSRLVQSADGKRVVSQHALPDHCLIGWRAGDEEWERTWTVSTADLSVDRMALSADARLFAMLTRPALGSRWWEYPLRLEVRDAATAAVRVTAEFPSLKPAQLLFSPDASQLVGFKDMTLIAWGVPDELRTLGQPQIVRNDNRKHFTAMAYHPDGRHLYATSNDATVHIFDTATWERTERFKWQLGSLKSVAVSSDGTLAAAGGDRGDVVVWDVDG